MPEASRVDMSDAFCSYCGYPPTGSWLARPHRVCRRCEMGVVLQAPSAPRHDAPFLIVDRQLAVQAVSRQAERALQVEEPAGLGAPLEKFLICNNGCRDGCKLAELVELALAGADPSNMLELRTVADPEMLLQARVTACGPPQAALLVLTPVASPATPSRKRRPASNGQPVGLERPDRRR